MNHHIRIMVSIAALAGLFSASRALEAGNGPGPASVELSLNDLMNLEIQSGSFLDLDLANSPFSMTVIDRRQIENSGARHLSELLEIYVPGFQYMYNKWNGTLWGMRGVANDRNTKFIFLVNGHKMNAESRDGFLGGVTLGLMGDIERVEVLRGPAGLVYGSGAIAGIVNLVTREQSEGSGEVQAGIGNRNDYEVEARTVSRLEGGPTLGLSLGARRSDGLGLHEARLYGKPQWPYPGALLPAKPKGGVPVDGSAWSTPGNYRLSADLQWGRFRWYSRATHQEESSGGFHIRDPWPEVIGAPDSTASNREIDGVSVSRSDPFWSQTESWGNNRRGYQVTDIMSDASYSLPLDGDEVRFKAGFDAQTNRIVGENRPGYESILAENPKPKIYETFGERRFTAGSMYLLNRFNGLQAAAGLELRLDDIGEDLEGRNALGGNPLTPIVTPVTYGNLAVYSEGLYRVNPALGLHLGIRYDIHTRTARFGGTLNPKAAAIVELAEGHTLKAIVQSSSNNGSADNYEYNRTHYNSLGELKRGDYFDNPNVRPTSLDELNRGLPTERELHSLRPEKVISYELASAHTFRELLILQPSFSFNQVSNLFVWNQNLLRVVNAGEYDFINLEMEAALRLEKFSLGVNHAWQRPVNLKVDEQSQVFALPHYDAAGQWFDSSIVDGKMYYTPVASEGVFDTVTINLIKDQISRDGENFLSLNTHVSKFFADYTPWAWLTLHSDVRVFWGLAGRDSLYADDRNKGFNTLFAENTPMYKVDVSGTFRFPGGVRISAYVYDLLGVDPPDDRGSRFAINTLRWQHSANSAQRDLYGMDRRSYALKMEKSF